MLNVFVLLAEGKINLKFWKNFERFINFLPIKNFEPAYLKKDSTPAASLEIEKKFKLLIH